MLLTKVDVLNNHINKIEDLKARTDSVQDLVGSIQRGVEVKVNHMLDKFDKISHEFARSEEASRIARKAADNLQEEYCRIIHSVATERKRNLQYIEKAKRDFIEDLTVMNTKVEQAQKLGDRLGQIK